MCRSCIAATLLAFAAACAAGPVPPPAGSAALDTWPRGVYYPWERHCWFADQLGMGKVEFADRMLGELAQRYHVDAIWTVNIGVEDAVQLCETAQKHGIGVMVSSVPIIEKRWSRSPELAAKAAQESFEAFGRLAAARGYVMPDEPRAWEMPWLNQVAARLRALDPDRPALAVTMTHDTQAAIEQPDLPIVCTDIYPFGFPRDPNLPNTPAASQSYYRGCTSALADGCLRTGKVPWMMPQVFCEIWGPWRYDEQLNVIAGKGAYLHWRMPTVGETRWQVWSAVCQGVRGFFYFVLFPGPAPAPDTKPADVPPTWPVTTEELVTGQGAALLRTDATPTPQMEAMAEAYAALEMLTPTLKRIRPARYPVASVSEPFECRTFEDPLSAEYFVAVVNNDTDTEREALLTLLPVMASATDLRSGTTLEPTADPATGLKTVALRLAPGDGTLIALALQPGARSGPAYLDDFSLANSHAAWSGARRVQRPRAMGMGWQWVAVVEQSRDDPQRAGTIEYDLAQLGGSLTGGEARYLVCEGWTAREDWESLIADVAAAPEGPWNRVMVDEPGQLTPLPADTARLRITLKGGASLTRVSIISTTTAQ
jgi:hypothetical protein